MIEHIDPARIRNTIDSRGLKTAGEVDGVLVGTAFWEERVRLKDVERERDELHGAIQRALWRMPIKYQLEPWAEALIEKVVALQAQGSL